MSSISYEPDKAPDMTKAIVAAKSLGWCAVNVVCEEPGAKVGEPTDVSFAAVTWLLKASLAEAERGMTRGA